MFIISEIVFHKSFVKEICKGELVELESIFKFPDSVAVITAENAIQALTKD